MRFRRIINSSVMPFENKGAPVATKEQYRNRLMKYFVIGVGLLAFSSSLARAATTILGNKT